MKRWIYLLMAATVSLSLASCAGEDPVGDDPDSENVTGGGSGSEDENGSGNENTEGGNETLRMMELFRVTVQLRLCIKE